MLIIIISAIIAAIVIMVIVGARILEGQNEVRHPPDDDGCREVKFDEQP